MNTKNELDSINRIIEQAIIEDTNKEGDITSKAIFNDGDTAKAIIKSKEPGIISGIYLLNPIFKKIDKNLLIETYVDEGQKLTVGTQICKLIGSLQSILLGERIILNFLQRLSGIATQTAYLNSLIKGTNAKLLDTRKTTPTLRLLEKKAVLAGGGMNHRFGLFDMILIKDTHVKALKGPDHAVQRAKSFCKNHPRIKIEVEVKSVAEFIKAFDALPDRIMFDNMRVEDMKQCVMHRNKQNSSIELEASGNVSDKTIKTIAETGVDYISVGSLTHSVQALDIHLVLI